MGILSRLFGKKTLQLQNEKEKHGEEIPELIKPRQDPVEVHAATVPSVLHELLSNLMDRDHSIRRKAGQSLEKLKLIGCSKFIV